jgi:curved DNA-binding protein CbpA
VSGCTLVTQDKFQDDSIRRWEKHIATSSSYYSLLELTPAATLDEVRRAYRQKSKLYHPDTTLLPSEVAVQKFRELNEAYAVLSNPERRQRYDTQPGPPSQGMMSRSYRPDFRDNTPSTAALDPKERTLSPGEVLALLILGATFLVCLMLAIILGVARGEMVIQNTHFAWPIQPHPPAAPAQSRPSPPVAPHKPALQSTSIKRTPRIQRHSMEHHSPAQPKMG